MSDIDRKAAELAERIATENGGELPYRLIGYNLQTDERGEFVLLCQRSPLELRPTEVRAHPALLKQIVGAYIVMEGRQTFAPIIEPAKT